MHVHREIAPGCVDSISRTWKNRETSNGRSPDVTYTPIVPPKKTLIEVLIVPAEKEKSSLSPERAPSFPLCVSQGEGPSSTLPRFPACARARRSPSPSPVAAFVRSFSLSGLQELEASKASQTDQAVVLQVDLPRTVSGVCPVSGVRASDRRREAGPVSVASRSSSDWARREWAAWPRGGVVSSEGGKLGKLGLESSACWFERNE